MLIITCWLTLNSILSDDTDNDKDNDNDNDMDKGITNIRK